MRTGFAAAFAAVLLLASCSGPESRSPDTLPRPADTIPRAEKMRLLPLVEGGWVETGLADSIAARQSVKAAWDSLLFEAEMCFDISNLSGDTLFNGRGRLNYHEGERFDIVFKKEKDGRIRMDIDDGRNYTACPLVVTPVQEGGDSLLLLASRCGDSNGSRFRRVFRKPPARHEADITALEYFVNSRLFAGRYEVESRSGFLSTGTVQFNENGSVYGLVNYSWYRIETDFSGNGSAPFDMIMLGNETGEPFASYAWEKKGGVLLLYRIAQSNGQTQRGPLEASLHLITQ